METNDSPHLVRERAEYPEKKRIKLDRSGLDLNLSKPDNVSNGVKNEVKNLKKDEKPHSLVNNVKPSSENTSLKRPAAGVLSDCDDLPLLARTKKHSSDKSSSNDVKKIKKIKHSSDSSGSPQVEKPKKTEDRVKKIKSESGSSTPTKSDNVKKLKVDPTKGEGVKNIKSDSSSGSKIDGIKKVKTEPGLTSPTKSSDIKKVKTETGSSTKSDGVKKIKPEGDASLKIKSESTSKTSDAKKQHGLLSPKTENIKKEKQSSSPSPKLEGGRSKEGSPSKSEKDKHKTISSAKEGQRKESGLTSPKADGVKKDKHKISSSKSAGGLTSPKMEGIKKDKSKISSSESPKVDGVKKVKSESSPEKKAKDSSQSAKGETVKKLKSESSAVASVKDDGVKKVKTESGATDSSSGKEKVTTEESDNDDVPLATRVKEKAHPGKSKERKRKGSDDDDDDDYKPLKKLKKKSDVGSKDTKKEKPKSKEKEKPKKGKDVEKTEKEKKGKDKKEKDKKEKDKKEKDKKEQEVWKWWEEEKHPEGIKWLTLEHKGPYFPPVYEPLPDDVNFYYNGEKVKLSLKSEEVAGFYAKMLDHDYTSKKIFNDNFFEDWRKEMSDEERALIKNLSKCDFKEIHAYYVQKNEERKNMTKEEKQVIKDKNEEILQEYGYCMMDNHRERVGNFKIEPPGLFRGRGDHPKQGKLKKRLQARDIIINIGKGAKVPDPPEGQRWKAVQHDNKVTWLACWIENIQGSYKYVMLNPTSRIKGEKDWQKYETARKLKKHIHKIREDYTNDWRSKEMRIRQRGVALYFIDKLALRAGHEKDEDTADTVGCCSLRYEHIKLHKQLDDKEYVVEFDFLGKDSIHYHNVVQVEKRVFKNLELFKQGKSDGDDLFDRLSTTSLNKYLSELMEGLSAKVFRTYNASMTLQEQLNQLEVEDNVAANVLGYNRANRAVAILCNHQRSVPKTFEQSMLNLQQKIDDKKKAIKDAKNELKDLKHEAKGSESVTLEKKIEKKKTAIDRLKEQLFKLEVSQTDKNENKEIALGTSKLNYLDPRISIAWCLKNKVPIEKIYNKTQREKFAWAIDMTEEDFVF